MTEASHNVFVDRRSDDEKRNGLATQILYWYDRDSKKRIRTNGITVDTEGNMIVARSTCSRHDQFVKAMGRMKVAHRIFGRAQNHCWAVKVPFHGVEDLPAAFAKAYADMFESDEMGTKRAYNIGKVFTRYRQSLTKA